MASQPWTASDEPALRPLTMPRLAPKWDNDVARQLAALKQDVANFAKVELSLQSVSDELVADATETTAQGGASRSANLASQMLRQDREGESHLSLSGAALTAPTAVEAKIVALTQQLEQQANMVKALGEIGLEEGWTVNDGGAILNEEGLPIFEIHEELPPLEPVAPAAAPAVAPAPSEVPMSKPRYLIQRKGKQFVGPTYPLPAPSAPIPAENPIPIVLTAERIAREKLFDEWEEQEKADEAAVEMAAGMAGPVVSKEADAATAEEQAKLAESMAELKLRDAMLKKQVPPAPIVRSPAAAKPFGFAAGFLKPNKGKGKAVDTPHLPTTTPSPPLPQHTPLHRVLPPSKSIHKPTPPPSAPSTRPSSPKPDRRVLFNLPSPLFDTPVATRAPKVAIPLPAPPTAEQKAEEEKDRLAAEALKNKKQAEPFVRPAKSIVIERPIAPPTLPSEESNFRSERLKLASKNRLPETLGRAPKVQDAVAGEGKGNSVEGTEGSSVETGPVHTLSLSQSGETTSRNGQASAQALLHEQEEQDRMMQAVSSRGYDEDEDDESDSSGFYGSEAEESYDEEGDDLDIDGALQAREVALEYHRQRMNVGAGAGTGSLGGFRDPEAYDAWNQASVPQETTLLGRVAGNSNASRFRKGRLESAQMIIPSLFAANIRNDNGEPSDGEDDDGLSVLERENIREILAKLAQSNPGEDQSEGIFLSDTKDVLGRKIQTNQAMTTMESVLGTPAVPLPKARVAASSSTPRGNLIAVPTNEMVREPEKEETVAAPAPPVKKMSRFKARQLGLEFEE